MTDLADVPADVRSWADLFAAADPDLRERLGLRAVHLGRATVIAGRVDHLLLNRVWLHEGATAADLAAACEGLGPRFLVHAHAVPSHLRDALASAGLAPFRRDWLRFVRRAPPPVSEPGWPTVERARPSDRPAVARILGGGFDLPPDGAAILAGCVGRSGWHTYVVRGPSGPIAAASLYASGEEAYLAFAATLPEWRGRRAQTALIAKRLQVAHGLGCRIAVVETGAPLPGEPQTSGSNLERAGFRPVERIRNFAPPGVAWP